MFPLLTFAKAFRPKRHGLVHSFANQYIETSFILFFLPLSSYFVNLNTKETIEIPLNKNSLRVYYISTGSVLMGISFFFLMIFINPWNVNWGYLPAILSGIVIAFGLVYNFIGGRPDKSEIKRRAIFQSIVNINALPQWLADETARDIYEQHKHTLPHSWKEKILKDEYSSDEFFFYYTMLAYETKTSPTQENRDLLALLDRRIKK